MGEVTNLSAVEQKAYETVQSVLSEYVEPRRLIARRNSQPNYFTIRLDDKRELCFIVRQPASGNLSYIACNRTNDGHFKEEISSPADIPSIKDKLVYKLKAIAREEKIQLDIKKEAQKTEVQKTEEQNKKGFVCHYTKMEALGKIFLPKENGGKIRLRFTNVRFLNDPSEGLVFKKFCENYKEKTNNNLSQDLQEIINKEPAENMVDLDNGYIFSMSNLKDSFAFWNHEYAGLGGIAIVFDKSEILKLKDFIVKDVRYIDINYKENKDEYTEEELIEQENEQLELIRDIESIVSKSNDSSKDGPSIMRISSWFCKQKSWEHESEMRIIKNKPSNIEVRFDNNNIKKYCYEYFDASIVRRIILGPECNDAQVEAVKYYLKDNGYDIDKIKVEKSHAFEL